MKKQENKTRARRVLMGSQMNWMMPRMNKKWISSLMKKMRSWQTSALLHPSLKTNPWKSMDTATVEPWWKGSAECPSRPEVGINELVRLPPRRPGQWSQIATGSRVMPGRRGKRECTGRLRRTPTPRKKSPPLSVAAVGYAGCALDYSILWGSISQSVHLVSLHRCLHVPVLHICSYLYWFIELFSYFLIK